MRPDPPSGCGVRNSPTQVGDASVVDSLCRFFAQRGADRTLSQDLCQDVIAWVLGRFPGSTSLGGNAALLWKAAPKFLSSAKRRRGREQLLVRKLSSAGRGFSSIDPAEQAQSTEATRLVRAAVENLPHSYREPILLHYFEGRSVRESAGNLGLSEEAVKVRLHRARHLLRARLAALTAR